MSGAPKVSAVNLVAKLEPECRYIYAGAVGYVSFRGVLDTAIAIRTMMVHKGKIYMQAGAGITYDSDPTLEYDETLNKLMGVVRAVQSANKIKRGAANTLEYETGKIISSASSNIGKDIKKRSVIDFMEGEPQSKKLKI